MDYASAVRSLQCAGNVPAICHALMSYMNEVCDLKLRRWTHMGQVACITQALKEAYLPESGIWVAKYPFVDRDVFLDISLDIARAV